MKQFLVRVYHSEKFRSVVSPLCFFFALLGLDIGIRYLHRSSGLTDFYSPIPWVFTLAWCFLLTALPLLFGRVGRRIAAGGIGGVFLLLYLTNAMMRKAKGNFFSFSSLMYAADGLKFLDASYLQVRTLVWLVFFMALALVVLAVVLVPMKKPGKGQRIVSLAVAAVCILAINLNRELKLEDRVQIHFNIFQDSLLYEDFSDPNNCLLLTGLYQYTFRDFCMTYGVYDKLDRMGSGEELRALESFYETREVDPDNDWTGRFAGKNLILIQLEAIDTWMLTEESMPNLWAIREKSLDFTNHYAPLYSDAGTFNTEMVVNTGLVSPFVGSTASMYSRNAYPYSLAHLMTEAGYTANSFHRSTPEIYNRGKIHANWGYGHYYGGEEMGISPEELDFDGALMGAYDTIVPAEGPFLSFIITYSGHGPYEGSDVSKAYYAETAARLPADTPEMVVHGLAHAWATDLFIGKLYDRLEAEGRLEDTVLCFYSDHYDYYVMDDGLIMDQKGIYDKNLIMGTPFFIFGQGTEPRKVEKVTSTVDVLPTLVNLFGLDYDGRSYVGNDAFSENGGYAIFKDYSWYDGETYWNSMAGETPSEAVTARNRELKTRLDMSWTAMRTNYFGK